MSCYFCAEYLGLIFAQLLADKYERSNKVLQAGQKLDLLAGCEQIEISCNYDYDGVQFMNKPSSAAYQKLGLKRAELCGDNAPM